MLDGTRCAAGHAGRLHDGTAWPLCCLVCRRAPTSLLPTFQGWFQRAAPRMMCRRAIVGRAGPRPPVACLLRAVPSGDVAGSGVRPWVAQPGSPPATHLLSRYLILFCAFTPWTCARAPPAVLLPTHKGGWRHTHPCQRLLCRSCHRAPHPGPFRLLQDGREAADGVRQAAALLCGGARSSGGTRPCVRLAVTSCCRCAP